MEIKGSSYIVVFIRIPKVLRINMGYGYIRLTRRKEGTTNMQARITAAIFVRRTVSMAQQTQQSSRYLYVQFGTF